MDNFPVNTYREGLMSDTPVLDDPEYSMFEESSLHNGGTFWLATALARFLGYEDIQSLRPAISRAQSVCINLDIPVEDNFQKITNPDGGSDTKLTRSACYLVAMNADPKKPQVAKFQAIFAALAESVRLYREQVENMARVQLRGEITTSERSLAQVAKSAEVNIVYGIFQNAGYRGMYNMNISELREYRDIPANRSPLDFMRNVELAANLFRITQTDERIRQNKIKGQRALEEAANTVGRQVRETMIASSGVKPENLPKAIDIREVRKEIKATHKTLKKIDGPKKKN